MKTIIKVFGAIIVAILLLTAVYYAILEEPEDIDDTPEDDNKQNGENNDQNDGNETDDSDENTTDNRDILKYVFIEKGTGETCEYCVPVGKILHELYESEKFPLYYVSMVRENNNAESRLVNDYNIYFYPTVFIDGGYLITYGNKEKSVFQNLINQALERQRPEIYVNVTSEWDKNSSEIDVSGFIENLDNDSYNGFLKLYLTEKISTRYNDNEGNAYHFSFVEFILEEDLDIQVNESYDFSKSYEYGALDPENLKIFAVVFNSDSTQKYSDPKEDDGPGQNEHSFNAYYVDGVEAADVVEGGNTPPAVGINTPKQGRIHLFGNPIINYNFKNTFIIGRTTIEVTADDDSKIEKVEFYIDDELVKEDTSEPYEFSFRKIGIFKNILRKHTIKVIAYDDEGKTAQDSIGIIAFFL